MSNKKQEEQKEQGLAFNGWDMTKNIIVTLIISATVIMVAIVAFNIEPNIEYEQLPVCSLNTLVVGQTYEVNGEVLLLEDFADYREDGINLYFELLE